MEFYSRFIVGSVPGMREIKKCLPSLHIKLRKELKTYLRRQISKFNALSILKREGR